MLRKIQVRCRSVQSYAEKIHSTREISLLLLLCYLYGGIRYRTLTPLPQNGRYICKKQIKIIYAGTLVDRRTSLGVTNPVIKCSRAMLLHNSAKL